MRSIRTKNAFGYFPGVATIGGVIVGVENRSGNENVKFHQADTLVRFFSRLESRGVHVGCYRADCGSFSKDIASRVSDHADKFFLRASNCQSRLTDFKRCKTWKPVTINDMDMEVASFTFILSLSASWQKPGYRDYRGVTSETVRILIHSVDGLFWERGGVPYSHLIPVQKQSPE